MVFRSISNKGLSYSKNITSSWHLYWENYKEIQVNRWEVPKHAITRSWAH
jgi:hypothetical protein